MFGWMRQRRLRVRARQIGQDMIWIRSICENQTYEAIVSHMIAHGYTSLGEHVQRDSYRQTSFKLGQTSVIDIMYSIKENTDKSLPVKMGLSALGFENLYGLMLYCIPPTGYIDVDVMTLQYPKDRGDDAIAICNIMLEFPGFYNMKISCGMKNSVK